MSRSISIVIPCYNEQDSLPSLKVALAQLESVSGWDIELIFVDDGSKDATWETLESLFGSRSATQLLRQENRGLSAAIFEGITRAHNEVVCSLDADGSYDPLFLIDMVPLLEQDTALVTGSPYHPSGHTSNTLPSRIFLSRTLSKLYACLLSTRLHTYTSCLRVYRRSLVLDLNPQEPGFLGVAELLALLDMRQRKIQEVPVTLTARKHGTSSMRILPAIAGHLRLLLRLARMRYREDTTKLGEKSGA